MRVEDQSGFVHLYTLLVALPFTIKAPGNGAYLKGLIVDKFRVKWRKFNN